MKHSEKTIGTKKIFKGKIINLRVDNVLLENGNTSTREIVEHNGGVAILAINKNGNVFLVKQFRKPFEKELIELPAGKLESGEKPEECAIRELEEEIGYKANKIEKLNSIYTSPGFSNEIIHIFLALDLQKTKIHRDENEFMDVIEISLEEAKKMIDTGQIHDAKTIIGILSFLLKN
ncbi:NUDIX hydrolase [Garciella nitratireducens]|uniref:ADP-ribose pyrophosphatase n=1 Tax=Garciella nitratireducens DSM 15102 TaxID=1121911 RepID=A0A1T4JU94_9FIRM|nr:NUDIX hydrolase [Garciella nitratireducens]RBP45572.1 ADP-ribose pyrophosphatase [Garciella nitratireducens]SJZ33685.1 ADP-ribose pyrophosphatase [Garciella nitratireducens DSM 15102]